jgi:hypothetical protein
MCGSLSGKKGESYCYNGTDCPINYIYFQRFQEEYPEGN